MIKRVLVQKGYVVPDRYLDLEDCEQICETCRGAGKVRVRYGETCGPGDYLPCHDCGGDGKRLKCSGCGGLCNHGIIRAADDKNITLCYNCLKRELGLNKGG